MIIKKEPCKDISGNLLHAIVNVWDQSREMLTIPICGYSMYPLIREGDNVLVECGYSHIGEGDIIAFRHNNKLIVHRVLSISENQAGFFAITKGDNVPHLDPSVNHREIIGRVTAIKRGKKILRIDGYIGTLTGWLIIRSTSVVRALCGFKRKSFTGNKPGYVKTIVNRGIRFLFLIFRKGVFLVLCRWKLLNI